MATQKVLTIVACVLMLCASAPTLAVADQAQYIYDDLGRLSQVIDGQGNVATYTYDAVGNLLAITRATGGVGTPTITGLTPGTGATGTTVTVTLTGTNLSGAMVATDNPGLVVRNVATTPTSLTASFVVAHTARVGVTAVTVRTSLGTAGATFAVTAGAPVLTSLSPTSGPVTRVVTLTGAGFSASPSANLVRFNGTAATPLSATPTSLTVQVPSGATTGPVTVTVGGLTSTGVPFSVGTGGPPPTLSAVTPTVGSTQGGQQVTLTGTGFVSGSTVAFGNKRAGILTQSATSMTVIAPANSVGPADVVVSNVNGDAVAPAAYAYVPGAPLKIGVLTPTMGLINTPRNAPVTVSFSRPVDRTSITPTTFGLTQGSTPVVGTYGFEYGDTVVTFRPSAVLAATTAYTLTLTQDIRSTDGIPLDGPFFGSFTTGTVSDTASPTVTITPQHGATDVPYNTTVLLSFSEPINPNTVNASTFVVVSQGEIRAGTITFGQQNTFAVFTPASPFFPAASATVTVQGAMTDLAGNLLRGTGGVGTGVTATFTTGSTADRLPPVVLQLLPGLAATGISTRTSLSATFSESVNPTTILPTTFRVTSGGAPVAGTFALSNLNQTVTFVPAAPLPPVATVDVAISGVADVVGNVMVLPFTSRFQTQSAIDNLRPSVVRSNPGAFPFQAAVPSNANIPLNFQPTIAFDERIDPTTVNATSFYLSIPQRVTIPTAVTVGSDGLSARLTPLQPLVPNMSYSVSYTADIHDLVGNPLLNPGGPIFTTGPAVTDTTPPQVSLASPRTGTQQIPVNAVVTVLFSEPINFTSITPQTVILSAGGIPVATQLTLERNNTVLRIKPANLLLLQANTFYELTITAGVLDLVGNPLALPFAGSFTTGTATDTAGPTVTSVDPPVNATSVSRFATVRVTFSEPVNPITVTSETFSMGTEPGTITVASDLRSATFTPTEVLFANAAYGISVRDVEDLAGNRGTGGGGFRTAAAPGTNLADLPREASLVASPSMVFADGQTTTITVSNVSYSPGGSGASVLVPNGTVVGVMEQNRAGSIGGGTVLGGTPSPSDPRVRLFTTLGGAFTVTFRTPNRPDLLSRESATVQVVSVDPSGIPTAPSRTATPVLGLASVLLSRDTSVLATINPPSLVANGSSTAEITFVVKDAFGTPVPAGVQYGVTVEPVYDFASAGGTINGGTVAADPRFKIFTTTTGGVIDFTYTAPSLPTGQVQRATLQVVQVDSGGKVVRQLAHLNGLTTAVGLNQTPSYTGPLPTLVALSPAHTQSAAGTNVVIEALFTQSLDVATVTTPTTLGGPGTFSVTSGTVLLPGTLSFHPSERGANTLVRFTPTAPLAASGTFTIAITTGIRNTTGLPLLSVSSGTFSTGTAADTIPPSVTQIMPADGNQDIATNRLISVQFSEPMNATTLNATSFTVSTAGAPIAGRVTVGVGPHGPNTLATFIPHTLLAPTTTYTVTLAPSILDTARNPLGGFSSSFTSGATIDNFKPSVVSTSPVVILGREAKLVPLDARVFVQFSEPINPLTITSNSLQLLQEPVMPGPSYPSVGTLTVSPDLQSVAFTPSRPLIPGGIYRLLLDSSITDLAGNQLSVYGGIFETGTQLTDPTALAVTVSPLSGDTGIGINAPILLKFSKPIAAPTVNSTTLVVTGPGGPLLGTITFEQEQHVVRWTPANLIQFAPNSQYSVSISTGVTDLAGVPLGASVLSSFTTGGGVDTTAPTVVSAIPAFGATGVARNATLEVTFSEPINPATVVLGATARLMGPGNALLVPGSGLWSLPGTVAVSADRRHATVTPSQLLFGNVQYIYSFSGVEDLAGNRVPPSGADGGTFTTPLAPGTDRSAMPVRATVTSNPTTLFADGSQSTTVTVSGIALQNSTLVPNGTVVAVSAQPALDSSSAGGRILGGTPSPDGRFVLFPTLGGKIEFTYQAPDRPDLLSGGAGRIQIASVDADGIPASSLAAGFGSPLIGTGNITLIRGTIVDSFFNPGETNGQALRADGVSTADVRLTLLNSATTVTPASMRLAITVDPVFQPSAGGTIHGGTPALDPRFHIFPTLPGGDVEFTYSAPILTAATATAVFQAAAVDDQGTVLRQIPTGQNQGFLNLTATGGASSPLPLVVALSPAQGQTGVGTNARVAAKFSQPIDRSSIRGGSGGTFTVSVGSLAVPGTFSFAASERGPDTLVTFTPSTPLPANMAISVGLTSGIKNTGGGPLLLNSLSNVSFSTGSGPDTTGPTIVQVNPPNGVLSAGTNAVVTIEFNEPIDSTTLSPTTVVLSAGGVPIVGRVTVQSGLLGPNTQAVFVPNQLLGGAVAYTLAVGAGVTDTAGNPLVNPFASAFGTRSGIDNFQPTIESLSPELGETGVPLNTKVSVRFSEPVNPLTITSASVVLNGPPFSFGVPGTLTIAPDYRSVTLAPTQPLLPNTSYSIVLAVGASSSAIRDFSGNTLLHPNGSLGGFTTGSGPADLSGPQVTVVSPASGAVSVPTNGQVVLEFSEPLAAPTVTAQSLTVSAGGTTLAGDIILENSGRRVRFKVANLFQFAPNTLYTVRLTTDVTDHSGNALSGPFSSSFTTGSTTDTTAPGVATLTPAANATNVSRTTTIDITFTEDINPATLKLGITNFPTGHVLAGTISLSAASGGVEQGVLSYPNADRRTIRLTPTFPLRAGQVYSVNLSGIEDTAGNAILFNRSFTTALASGTDLSALPTRAVVTLNPTSVFADGQSSSTVTISNIVRANGVLVPNGTVIGVVAEPMFVLLSTNGQLAGGTIIGGIPSPADPRVRLFSTLNGSVTMTYASPNRPDLFNGGTALVQCASVDAAGAPMLMLGSASVTLLRGGYGQVEANPVALLANGSSLADVRLSMTDYPVSGGYLPIPAGITYAVTTEPVFTTSSVAGTLLGGTAAPDSRFRLLTTKPGGTLDFVFRAPLLPSGVTKQAVIQVAKVDGAGNLLSGIDYPLLTGDARLSLNGSSGATGPQPKVVTMAPAHGQTAVGTNTRISVKFSQPLDRSTVRTSAPATFTVTSGLSAISGTLSFAASEYGPDTLVTFTPSSPLAGNASVSVNITSGIKSVSGGALLQVASGTFSTGMTADLTSPTTGKTNPQDGASAVPVNTFISVEYSESLDATTVNPTTFSVTTTGSIVSGRFTFTDGVNGKQSIVTFVPDVPLLPSTTYSVAVASGVTDVSGNRVAPHTLAFTTSGAVDTLVPTLLSSVPSSGDQGVPATNPVTLVFSESVNPIAVNPMTVSLGWNTPFSMTLSENNSRLTITPTFPFFADAPGGVQLNGIRDVAGNPMAPVNFNFRVALAPGTTGLPTNASQTSNPPQLAADGTSTSQITISNVKIGSTPAPNGTRIAVSAHPSLSPGSLGGVISGPSVGTSVDGRFLLFETFGAQVVLTFTAPLSTTNGTAYIYAYSVDLESRPVSVISSSALPLTGTGAP